MFLLLECKPIKYYSHYGKEFHKRKGQLKLKLQLKLVIYKKKDLIGKFQNFSLM